MEREREAQVVSWQQVMGSRISGSRGHSWINVVLSNLYTFILQTIPNQLTGMQPLAQIAKVLFTVIAQNLSHLFLICSVLILVLSHNIKRPQPSDFPPRLISFACHCVSHCSIMPQKETYILVLTTWNLNKDIGYLMEP